MKSMSVKVFEVFRVEADDVNDIWLERNRRIVHELSSLGGTL